LSSNIIARIAEKINKVDRGKGGFMGEMSKRRAGGALLRKNPYSDRFCLLTSRAIFGIIMAGTQGKGESYEKYGTCAKTGTS
jgi:hypothetical protein